MHLTGVAQRIEPIRVPQLSTSAGCRKERIGYHGRSVSRACLNVLDCPASKVMPCPAISRLPVILFRQALFWTDPALLSVCAFLSFEGIWLKIFDSNTGIPFLVGQIHPKPRSAADPFGSGNAWALHNAELSIRIRLPKSMGETSEK